MYKNKHLPINTGETSRNPIKCPEKMTSTINNNTKLLNNNHFRREPKSQRDWRLEIKIQKCFFEFN